MVLVVLIVNSKENRAGCVPEGSSRCGAGFCHHPCCLSWCAAPSPRQERRETGSLNQWKYARFLYIWITEEQLLLVALQQYITAEILGPTSLLINEASNLLLRQVVCYPPKAGMGIRNETVLIYAALSGHQHTRRAPSRARLSTLWIFLWPNEERTLCQPAAAAPVAPSQRVPCATGTRRAALRSRRLRPARSMLPARISSRELRNRSQVRT